MSQPHTPWEPDPAQVGKNWTAMFEPSPRGASAHAPEAAPAMEEVTELPAHDTGGYRPWTLQRGSSRALMIDFRRYEPRMGRWNGWAIAYPQLVGIDYTGDALLGLDFGKVQVIVEGRGLDELARHLQQGTVIAIHEYAAPVWSQPGAGAMVSAIRKVEASG